MNRHLTADTQRNTTKHSGKEKGEMNMKRLMALVLAAVVTLLPFTALAGSGYTEFPKSAIAYMEIKYRCGCTRVGTGAMICANGLITAGHNLVCEKHHKTAKNIVFYFGYKSKSNYFYKYDDECSYWYFDSFKNGYQSKDDIGYVRFKRDVGKTTGWFATRYAGDAEFKGKSCRIGAYSSSGSLTIHSATLSVSSSKLFTFNKKELPYGGEGAPIFIYRNNVATLVGVYNSHTSTKCVGRRLTQGVFDDMAKSLRFERVYRN